MEEESVEEIMDNVKENFEIMEECQKLLDEIEILDSFIKRGE